MLEFIYDESMEDIGIFNCARMEDIVIFKDARVEDTVLSSLRMQGWRILASTDARMEDVGSLRMHGWNTLALSRGA